MPKFFFLDARIQTGESLTLTGEEARHISRSLRMKKGDTITLCDGMGNNYSAEISDISREIVKVNVFAELPSHEKSLVQIRLFLSLTKGDKIEYAIQKCVELGVHEIIPLQTSRTMVCFNDSTVLNRMKRWNRLSLEAAKQSGRSFIPLVSPPRTLPEALSSFEKEDLTLMAHLGEKATSLRNSLEGKTSLRVNLLIGPEGGFTREEYLLAKAAGAITVYMGPRILKSETAAIFCVGTVMYVLGDLDKISCQ